MGNMTIDINRLLKMNDEIIDFFLSPNTECQEVSVPCYMEGNVEAPFRNQFLKILYSPRASAIQVFVKGSFKNPNRKRTFHVFPNGQFALTEDFYWDDYLDSVVDPNNGRIYHIFGY
jgi:hypothetical protein